MGTDNVNDTTADDDDGNDDDGANEQESGVIKTLRKQIRGLEKEVKELRPLRETNAFLAAGLGDLSADHKMALRAVAGSDLSSETLKAKALVLGFLKEGTGGDTTKDTSAQDAQTSAELDAASRIEQTVATGTSQEAPKDFIKQIQSAKSQDELLALIAAQGEEHGLIIETE